MAFKEFDSYDGLGLAKLVADKQVSPRELVDEAIDRIERLNPAVNAVVHRQYERARREADGALPAGPFRGVPMLLKDLLGEQQGEPCTYSNKLLVDVRATHDSELVARLLRAGVVVVGRTNTPEFGILAVTEPALRGPARNPWDLDHTTGGSSGGSAAAVAARLVPFAHGGDGGGSIRIPAAHCGVFGLKPTRARNPTGPFVAERWGGLVVEHALTRSVRDSAALLDATQGPDLGAPYHVLPPARPYLEEVATPPGKLRIAFTTRALFGNDMHPDNVAAVHDAAALCRELGHDVEEATPEFDKATLVRAYLTKVAAGIAYSVRVAGEKSGKTPRSSDFEPPTWLLKLIGDAVSAGDYVYLSEAAYAAARQLAGFFERYPVLLTATAARPPVPVGALALKRGELLQLEVLRRAPLKKLLLVALETMSEGSLAATPNTMLWNLTGQPAMSVPLVWNAQGLPIGTQFVGRFGDEATLFRLAAQLEAARPWAGRLPPLLTRPGA